MANLKLAYEVAAASGEAATDLWDGGKLAIYDGTQPANPATAVTTQNKLVEFTLKSPAFGAPAAGTNKATLTLDLPDAVAAAMSGTASWARVTDSAGTLALADMDVTDPGGAGNLKISTTTVTSGIDVNVISFTYSQPQQ